MNNTTLARLCVNTNMSEEEEDELTAFLKQISETAESDKEYKSILTDYNIPMEAEYNRGHIYSENATVAKAYKDRIRLYALARSSNSSVRQAIAGFEYAPDEALLYLANNNLEMCKRSSQDIADAEKRDREICTAIASNPNASPYTLDILATTIIDRAKNSREAREWKWAGENIKLLQSALERYESEEVTNRYLTPKQRKQIIKETRNEIERKEGKN